VPIDSVEALRSHVALARQVEMSTIPPYLYAAYSIRDYEADSRRLIASVVVEEMLHLALTTNLLLALGGEPDFGEGLMPRYPGLLAHHEPDLPLGLRRCTTEVVRDTFMVIERPHPPSAPAEPDRFETLGQFYAALEQAIHDLSGDFDLFGQSQPERQLSDPSYYGAVAFDAADSGGLMLIDDVDSACRALDIVIDQGEGLSDHLWADPDHQELTHYHKFAQLADGTMPIGAVWPVVDDPKTADLPDAVRPAADLFNACYRLVFVTMEQMYAPGTDPGAFVGRLYDLMSRCLAPIARYLVTVPIGDGWNAGPTFEIHRFTGEPFQETLALAQSTAAAHPSLAPVAVVLESMAG
jgi:hypothetical protein